jgi:hypothetical protein
LLLILIYKIKEMGQYGNQPDFATKVDTIAAYPAENIKSAAIYIGAVTDPALTTTSITVRPVGNSTDVTFTGLTSGSFLPVIVTSITSAVNIPVGSVLLVY